jgi:hypothetical protein
MRHFIYSVLLLTVFCSGCTRFSNKPDSENIAGIWYRNSFHAPAVLTINEDMEFFVDALLGANEGQIGGKIEKIKDGHYISYIDDQPEECKITFLFNLENIELEVDGRTGDNVIFNGEYEKNKLSDNELVEQHIDYIFNNRFEKEIAKELLGSDIILFATCFASGVSSREKYDDKIIIEGWMPGLAPYYNGIIKIENNNNIYILLTDHIDGEYREEQIFRYYTNDILQKTIPDEFKEWHHFNEEKRIMDSAGYR